MADPRPGAADAMRRGPTWLLVRGEPGLGRLTETVSLAHMVGTAQLRRQIRLATSAVAVGLAQRLLSDPVEPFDLGRGADPQQTLIDSRDVQRLLERLRRRPPAALVVDGYPMLLPLLRQATGARLVALANLHDVRNPQHSTGARLLQESLHAAADLILVPELRRGWRRSRLGGVPLIRLPALVRELALVGGPPVSSQLAVVAVLGGGSRGDHRLGASTRAILTALDRAVARQELPSCRVFSGATVDGEWGEYPHLDLSRDPADCLPSMMAAQVVVARAGRSTLAEILAIGKPAVVVAAESDTLRGAEQAANATAAAAMSPAVVAWDLDRLDKIGDACRAALAQRPARWQPGNSMLWTALAAADI